MSMELIGIISVGVAVSALLKSFINGLREDMKSMETRLSDRLTALEHGQTELRERMAHLEGLLQGLRESVTGQSVARQKSISSSTPAVSRPDLIDPDDPSATALIR